MWLSVGQSVDGVGLGVGPRGRAPLVCLSTALTAHCPILRGALGGQGPTSATQHCLVALLTLDGAEGNM